MLFFRTTFRKTCPKNATHRTSVYPRYETKRSFYLPPYDRIMFYYLYFNNEVIWYIYVHGFHLYSLFNPEIFSVCKIIYDRQGELGLEMLCLVFGSWTVQRIPRVINPRFQAEITVITIVVVNSEIWIQSNDCGFWIIYLKEEIIVIVVNEN